MMVPLTDMGSSGLSRLKGWISYNGGKSLREIASENHEFPGMNLGSWNHWRCRGLLGQRVSWVRIYFDISGELEGPKCIKGK